MKKKINFLKTSSIHSFCIHSFTCFGIFIHYKHFFCIHVTNRQAMREMTGNMAKRIAGGVGSAIHIFVCCLLC